MKPLFLVAIATLCATSASAQTVAKRFTVRVGTISSAQECTVYEGVRASSRSSMSGSASGYANAYGAGGRASFRASSQSSFETFFVKDCFSHFEGIRTALQSALASSGTVAVAPGGYVLSGRVENVIPVAGGSTDQAIGGRYGSASAGLKVTVSITVADKAGRIVFGVPVVTQIDTDEVSAVRGTVSATTSSGEGLYGLLQQQVAMAVARKVAFHFRPLLVTQGGAKKIEINYGNPLIEAGNLLSVTSADGFSAATYRVTSVGEGTAIAQQLGDADSAGIGPGSRARVIEKGDPAANQSRLERVELP